MRCLADKRYHPVNDEFQQSHYYEEPNEDPRTPTYKPRFHKILTHCNGFYKDYLFSRWHPCHFPEGNALRTVYELNASLARLGHKVPKCAAIRGLGSIKDLNDEGVEGFWGYWNEPLVMWTDNSGRLVTDRETFPFSRKTKFQGGRYLLEARGSRSFRVRDDVTLWADLTVGRYLEKLVGLANKTRFEGDPFKRGIWEGCNVMEVCWQLYESGRAELEGVVGFVVQFYGLEVEIWEE
ncbi:hypothetical protein ABW19_dt0210134 [Dactylella cylindrospora]|nr:hypothetical protein ABW19_dt0210134 [Dactylella cylindrospora]